MNPAKVLFIDIETSPSLAWVWKRFKENISLDQVEQDGFVLCAAWKWLGKSGVYSIGNGPEEPDDDQRAVVACWEVLDQADIVIAHYGAKFDIPTLNARFALYGLPPPSPYKLIDTKDVCKKRFRFPSNKLEGLGRFFGLGSKHKTDFDLWKGCLHGDEKCWSRMIAYCMQDVRLLEKVYMKLRPWIDNHPNVNLFGVITRPSCPKCGGTKIQWRGHYHRTATQLFASFQCVSCGGWGRGIKSAILKEERKSLTTNA